MEGVDKQHRRSSKIYLISIGTGNPRNLECGGPILETTEELLQSRHSEELITLERELLEVPLKGVDRVGNEILAKNQI